MKIICCIDCKTDKPLSEFYANRIKYSLYVCIPCYKKRKSKYNKKGRLTLNNRYCAYKYSAKRRELEFNLSLKKFATLTSSACDYCGEFNYKKLKINGIDRINSDKGYVARNCVPSCFTCNRRKNTQPRAKFIKEIIQSAKFLTKKAA